MTDNEPCICILLLIGIPASGKTHFRQCLDQWFSNHNSLPVLKNVYTVPVSYDDFISIQYVNDEDSKMWKTKRMEICNSVGIVINMLKEKRFQCDYLLSGVFNMSIAVQSKFVIFIIDDNMYYQSMRYEYYKLAKKYRTGFCQFYLKATLKDALQYNSQRKENIIPESTIIRMFSKLEPPNPQNKWEELSLNIDSFTDFNETSMLESVTNIIAECLKNPVESLIDAKYKNQEITNSNIIHQVDLILRHIVGERIKETLSAIINKNNLKEVSQLYCNKRQVLLQKIKKGEIVLPFSNSIFQKNSKDDKELVKRFLLQHI